MVVYLLYFLQGERGAQGLQGFKVTSWYKRVHHYPLPGKKKRLKYALYVHWVPLVVARVSEQQGKAPWSIQIDIRHFFCRKGYFFDIQKVPSWTAALQPARDYTEDMRFGVFKLLWGSIKFVATQ